MAATITPPIDSLLPQLSKRYPDISFAAAEHCAWNPGTRTVFYVDQPDQLWQLFHELGHAVLDHRQYQRDIELLGFERDAWQSARQIAEQFSLSIPDEVIENQLDTYRDWLHSRSSCVNCSQTGLQTGLSEYNCPHCHATWRVNDARTCGLRRYRVD